MTDTYDEGGAGPNRPDAREDVTERFVERISAPLRASERLADSFEARVMSVAHAEVRAARDLRVGTSSRASLGWWRRPRTVSLSPIAGMGMAAGFLGIALLGEAGFRSARQSPAVSPATSATVTRGVATRDTVHIVRFVLTDARAKSISLVGDFNDWSREATQLTRASNGEAWIVSVELPPGRHEYAFLVRDESGEHWVADPFAVKLHDEFGTESSLVQVGNDGEHRVTSST